MPKRGVQSIGVGLDVLRCLAREANPLALRDVARLASMSPSRAHSYLASFVDAGMVIQDPQTGHYGLGPFALQLGLAALEHFDVGRAARGPMRELSAALGFSVFLAVWGNHGPTIVERVDGRQRTVLEIRVGTVLPLLDSAIGRVFLAYLPAATTRLLLPAARRAEIARAVSTVRRNGMGRGRGTLLAGFTALAVPIFDRAALPIAALSTIGQIGTFDDSYHGAIAARLKVVADALSRQLGWHPD